MTTVPGEMDELYARLQRSDGAEELLRNMLAVEHALLAHLDASAAALKPAYLDEMRAWYDETRQRQLDSIVRIEARLAALPTWCP